MALRCLWNERNHEDIDTCRRLGRLVLVCLPSPSRAHDQRLRDPRPRGSNDDGRPADRDDLRRAEQLGGPLGVYQRPATTSVAGFLGSPAMNLLPAQLATDARSV